MCSDARGSGAFRDITQCLFYRAQRLLAKVGKGRLRAANALKVRSGRARGSADKAFSVKPGRKPSGGEIGSENVDMSSDKQGERPCRRKSKGSCLKLI